MMKIERADKGMCPEFLGEVIPRCKDCGAIKEVEDIAHYIVDHESKRIVYLCANCYYKRNEEVEE